MPYSSFPADQLTLRDRLAIDRTVLANERTLLAFVRTALAMLLTGGSLVRLFPEERGLLLLGWIFLVSGVVVAAQGAHRYLRERRQVRGILGPRGPGSTVGDGEQAPSNTAT